LRLRWSCGECSPYVLSLRVNMVDTPPHFARVASVFSARWLFRYKRRVLSSLTPRPVQLAALVDRLERSTTFPCYQLKDVLRKTKKNPQARGQSRFRCFLHCPPTTTSPTRGVAEPQPCAPSIPTKARCFMGRHTWVDKEQRAGLRRRSSGGSGWSWWALTTPCDSGGCAAQRAKSSHANLYRR